MVNVPRGGATDGFCSVKLAPGQRASRHTYLRLGRTLQRWSAPLLAYYDTGGASNGGAEAINGLIELHRRVARGFRNPSHV